MMKAIEKQADSSGIWKRKPLPRPARYIDTVIAIVLLGLSIYHFTQPNQAWRSGVSEMVAFAVLISSAYVLPNILAALGNVAAAIGITILGVRHLIHGGGWKSGVIELLFAIILIVVAIMIYRDRDK